MISLQKIIVNKNSSISKKESKFMEIANKNALILCTMVGLVFLYSIYEEIAFSNKSMWFLVYHIGIFVSGMLWSYFLYKRKPDSKLMVYIFIAMNSAMYTVVLFSSSILLPFIFVFPIMVIQNIYNQKYIAYTIIPLSIILNLANMNYRFSQSGAETIVSYPLVYQ